MKLWLIDFETGCWFDEEDELDSFDLLWYNCIEDTEILNSLEELRSMDDQFYGEP
jgi:hypothetical protein